MKVKRHCVTCERFGWPGGGWNLLVAVPSSRDGDVGGCARLIPNLCQCRIDLWLVGRPRGWWRAGKEEGPFFFQAIASEQVASNMEQIASLIDSNLGMAQQAKAAADALKTATGELRQVVGQFKVV
jgi:hypothetical protein